MQRLAPAFQGLLRDQDDAEAGGVYAPLGAADGDGLAGDDGGDGVADVHGVGVHDPGHDLPVGADVGGGDVAVWADQQADLGGVATGEVLQLGAGQGAWVADDAPLGAAEGDVDQGALPGHPHGEGADLVNVGVRVEAQPALGRPSAGVVLHPVAGEHPRPAGLHGDGEVDRQFALRLLQDGVDGVVQVQNTGDVLQLPQGVLVRVGFGPPAPNTGGVRRPSAFGAEGRW